MPELLLLSAGAAATEASRGGDVPLLDRQFVKNG